jgi:hypothetical protein
MRRRIPLENLPLLGLVKLYQWLLSGWMPQACRFEPTCSRYAEMALRSHHMPRALALMVRRLARCHPYGGSGWDPPPDTGDTDFSVYRAGGSLPVSQRPLTEMRAPDQETS